MSSCCCSLAGTAACRYCSNNPYAETPPPVRTATVIVTDNVLITGKKTSADRIRSMTDEELAEYFAKITECGECEACLPNDICMATDELCKGAWLNWLKQEAVE